MNIVRAFFHSLAGLSWTLKHERAVQQEFFVLIFAMLLIFILPVSSLEKLALLGSIVFVIIVELINTAIEKTVDRISKEIHPLSKIAKDTGSAAVLLSLILCLSIWFVICFPLIKTYF